MTARPGGRRVAGPGQQRVALPVQGEAPGRRVGAGTGQRGAGVCLRVLRGLAEPHAHLERDAQFGAGPLGERRDAEPVGGAGQ